MENAVRNLNDLEDWFQQKKTPYYSIYHGRNIAQSMLLHRNSEPMSVDESWAELKPMIESRSYGGGVFTLIVRDDPNKLNIISGRTTIALNQLNDHATQGIAGINNIQSGPDAINKAVSSALEVYDLKRRVEDLQSELESLHNQSFVERAVNRITEHEQFPQMCEALLMRLLGTGASPAPTAVHGTPGQSLNSIEESLQRIQKTFPDIERFLNALSTWVDGHPDMAKSIFNEQILNQNG